jgi:hypothetical protein
MLHSDTRVSHQYHVLLNGTKIRLDISIRSMVDFTRHSFVTNLVKKGSGFN